MNVEIWPVEMPLYHKYTYSNKPVYFPLRFRYCEYDIHNQKHNKEARGREQDVLLVNKNIHELLWESHKVQRERNLNPTISSVRNCHTLQYCCPN